MSTTPSLYDIRVRLSTDEENARWELNDHAQVRMELAVDLGDPGPSFTRQEAMNALRWAAQIMARVPTSWAEELDEARREHSCGNSRRHVCGVGGTYWLAAPVFENLHDGDFVNPDVCITVPAHDADMWLARIRDTVRDALVDDQRPLPPLAVAAPASPHGHSVPAESTNQPTQV